MRLTPLGEGGLLLIDLVRHGDDRGFFSETHNRARLAEHGIDLDFVSPQTRDLSGYAIVASRRSSPGPTALRDAVANFEGPAAESGPAVDRRTDELRQYQPASPPTCRAI